MILGDLEGAGKINSPHLKLHPEAPHYRVKWIVFNCEFYTYRHGVTETGKEALQVSFTQSVAHYGDHDLRLLLLGPQQGDVSPYHQGYWSNTNRCRIWRGSQYNNILYLYI